MFGLCKVSPKVLEHHTGGRLAYYIFFHLLIQLNISSVVDVVISVRVEHKLSRHSARIKVISRNQGTYTTSLRNIAYGGIAMHQM